MLISLIVFAAVLLASYFGVVVIRRWSIANGVLDIPNERSSHDTPMPTGGGLVLVLVGLLSYLLISGFSGHHFAPGYFVGAILIAVVSWLDDLYSIAVPWRLLTHSVAASLVILDVGFWHEIYVPIMDSNLELGTIGAGLTFFWIVWMVNAYNFMDGIDGIAASQAVIAGTGWLLLGLLLGYNGIYFYSGILIFASMGFLIHNWQPAKIFMGDVGSSFLGFTLAAMPLLALKEKAENASIMPLAAIVFVWFFLFDTALTFFVRVFKGKKFWSAHRDHIYQKLTISGLSHKSASLLYAFLSALSVAAFLLWLGIRGWSDFLFLSVMTIGTLILVVLATQRPRAY